MIPFINSVAQLFFRMEKKTFFKVRLCMCITYFREQKLTKRIKFPYVINNDIISIHMRARNISLPVQSTYFCFVCVCVKACFLTNRLAKAGVIKNINLSLALFCNMTKNPVRVFCFFVVFLTYSSAHVLRTETRGYV